MQHETKERPTNTRPWNQFKQYCLYGTLGVLATIYGMAALMKLTKNPAMAARLEEAGFAGSWPLFIGVTELAGTVAMFIPKLRRLALLGLWPYAVGGLAVHMSYGHERLYPGIIASLLIPLCLWLDGGLIFQRKPLTSK